MIERERENMILGKRWKYRSLYVPVIAWDTGNTISTSESGFNLQSGHHESE